MTLGNGVTTMTTPRNRPMQSFSAHESKEVIESGHVVREHVPRHLVPWCASLQAPSRGVIGVVPERSYLSREPYLSGREPTYE